MMASNITLALIGGTGKAGKQLLNNLLTKNMSVKLLHRKPDTLNISHPLLQIVKGDARDPYSIRSLLQGCNAVISCLGQPAGELPIFSEATGHILNAMNELGIQRYILLAGLNLDIPTDNKGPQTQAATDWMQQHFPATCGDRQKEYELLNQSNTDWSIVRIPMLIQTEKLTEVIVNMTDCPGQQISSASLGEFMTGLLLNGEYVKQAPFIANS